MEDILTPPQVEQPLVLQERRWTVDEYYAMARAGILREQDRVELINGKIINMSPIGWIHARTVTRLTKLFIELILEYQIEGVDVSPQNPVRLGSGAEPEPDIALVRLPEEPEMPIGPEHVLLLIEVAQTSLRYDREIKLPIYAEAGIPEVWIVALEAQRVEVYRHPTPTGYKEAHFLSPGDTVNVEPLSSTATVAVAALFA